MFALFLNAQVLTEYTLKLIIILGYFHSFTNVQFQLFHLIL